MDQDFGLDNFWCGKKVLVTGHTGFKGAWLTIWLRKLGGLISGVALPPETTPSLFHLADVQKLCAETDFCDVRDFEQIRSIARKAQPEIVFHLAAQPLVRRSYRQPLDTFATNVMGTANLLEALREIDSVRVVVVVTTDKVYRNLEHCWPYREDDGLGGYDPYSASKAACEIVVDSYRDAFFREQGIAVATARAGNVIGGGDWSEDRLIPDVVRAVESQTALKIRRPQAVRPWQHVLEPLYGYLLLAKKLWQQPSFAGAYNFGPETASASTVEQVVKLCCQVEPRIQVEYGTENAGPHEAGWLSLEIAKARAVLGYHPCWSIAESVQRTMAWYAAQRHGESALELCQAEICAYEQKLATMSNSF
jgi:CDP-glucose 4,6-dehydratase